MRENTKNLRKIGKRQYSHKIEKKCSLNICKDVQSHLYLEKFKIKVHEITRNREELHQIDKEYKKTTANIILNGEKLEPF